MLSSAFLFEFIIFKPVKDFNKSKALLALNFVFAIFSSSSSTEEVIQNSTFPRFSDRKDSRSSLDFKSIRNDESSKILDLATDLYRRKSDLFLDNMKGISAIVATLLILIITIGLAGLAYSYISGVFTTKTKTISLVDAFCAPDENGDNVAHFVIRNEGTTAITHTELSVVKTGSSPCDLKISTGLTIKPGSTVMLNTTGDCGTGSVSFRLIGPSNAIQLNAYCP